MSAHFTPQGPYTTGGNFTSGNANNIENGIEAVDNAKADLAGATFTGAISGTSATFSGNISTTGTLTATGNVNTSGLLLFGAAVSGSQAQLFYSSGLHAVQVQPPLAGASAQGIAFGAWDGAAGAIPFSVGGQFNGALSWVDTSGHFHDATGPVLAGAVGLTGKWSAQSTAPATPATGDLWLDTSVSL